jgi:hypothetical protein
MLLTYKGFFPMGPARSADKVHPDPNHFFYQCLLGTVRGLGGDFKNKFLGERLVAGSCALLQVGQ